VPTEGETFAVTSEQLSSGYTQAFEASDKASFSSGGASHTVTVSGVSTSTATIIVESTPQQATLNVGEVKKFELSGDNYYDLSVKLNSITNGKANLTVISINELMPAGETSPVAASNETTVPEVTEAAGGMSAWIWVLIAVAVVVVVIIVAKKMRK
jgi:hypothetical protein